MHLSRAVVALALVATTTTALPVSGTEQQDASGSQRQQQDQQISGTGSHIGEAAQGSGGKHQGAGQEANSVGILTGGQQLGTTSQTLKIEGRDMGTNSMGGGPSGTFQVAGAGQSQEDFGVQDQPMSTKQDARKLSLDNMQTQGARSTGGMLSAGDKSGSHMMDSKVYAGEGPTDSNQAVGKAPWGAQQDQVVSTASGVAKQDQVVQAGGQVQQRSHHLSAAEDFAAKGDGKFQVESHDFDSGLQPSQWDAQTKSQTSSQARDVKSSHMGGGNELSQGTGTDGSVTKSLAVSSPDAMTRIMEDQGQGQGETME